jgi:membrane protease YdiL (CAAX protease family)
LNAYATAVLVVVGFSSFSLAGQVYSRWLIRSRLTFSAFYCIILATFVVWGISTVGLEPLGTMSHSIALWGAGIGAAAGFVAWRMDRLLIRKIARARNRSGTVRRQNRAEEPALTAMRRSISDDSGFAARRRVGYQKMQQNRKRVLGDDEWTKITGVAVAVLEECVYRGLLLHTVERSFDGFTLILAALALTIAFAFSHIWFGLDHVVAKFPLSFILLFLALAFHNIFAPIAAHVLYNYRVVSELKKSVSKPYVRFRDKLAQSYGQSRVGDDV